MVRLVRRTDHVIPERKSCQTCRVEFPIENFHRDINRKDAHGPQCKDCKNAGQRAYREANAEMFKHIDRRQTLKGHGLTVEDYEGLLENQGGACAICGTLESNGRGVFHVDHDHSCCAGATGCHNCIRGLLCGNCNQGLGKFSDRIDLLEAAIAFLKHTAAGNMPLRTANSPLKGLEGPSEPLPAMPGTPIRVTVPNPLEEPLP